MDNGLGIDLKRYKHDLFKLYKRFHQHTEGKGLGLYLVKLQAEALGGSVEIESEINRSTTFTVYLKEPENIERQILFAEPCAQLFYDAKINATGVIWHGPISSDDYRTVFKKALECIKIYATPNYIADISNQGYVSPEDQQWMFGTIIPEATRYGLRKVASIHPESNNEQTHVYMQTLNTILAKYGVVQLYFTTFNEACAWLHNDNERLHLETSA